MSTTIKQSFEEYASNLNIKDRQSEIVSNCRANVTKKIGNELTLHPEESKVIGSWDRNTLIRYLSEGDVDVMVILHYGDNKDWYTSDGTIYALDKFKSILDDAYPDTPKRRDVNCITMQLSEFRLDVVPAFKWGDGGKEYYKIPDSIQKLWLPTDPFTFAEKITEVNTRMEDTFVPLIKMIKGWSREVGHPIRGFHLECMMYNHYKSYDKAYSYDSTINVFLDKLPGYLSSACYDPITSDRVDTYLDNDAETTDREIAINKAKKASEKADEAYNDREKYPITSIKEWKDLLGEFFPAYG